jgi:hypothetical protein
MKKTGARTFTSGELEKFVSGRIASSTRKLQQRIGTLELELVEARKPRGIRAWFIQKIGRR